MPVLDWVLDLLFPPKCPFCGRLLEKGELLCPDCQRGLPWLEGRAGETEVELTAGCVSALRYEDKVRSAIHGYKFDGRSARSVAFGALTAQAVGDHGITADLVSWPSLSKKRLRQRGYDQAELLAREVGRRLGLSVLRTVDKRERPAQSGIQGEAARRANLLGAYVPVEPGNFEGRIVLLVDDVVTSGATLAECAKTLRLAGAERIFCATLAKAGK
ncbi:MAG: ComF family protein [Oscillospiraceae bacterium]|nr:ComF family protein [Oscillospiraceae bacterium]